MRNAHRARGTLLVGLGMAVGLALAAPGAAAAIYLNEVFVHPPEVVELFNSGAEPVDLTGWRIVGSDGVFYIPDGTVIGPGSYLVLSDLGGIMDNIGGETSVIDFASGLHDRVNYGNRGGAPLPHGDSFVSLARAPDALALPPLDPEVDAVYWTLDFTSTFGGTNNALPPQLGSSVRINEIDPSDPDGDTVEFFNPFVLAVDIPLTDWILTDGTTAVILTGVVPAGGVLALALPTSIETAELAYLFDPDGVRVDQVGFFGAPLSRIEGCIGRCPDGAGPSDGYDYETSGGGSTWLVMTCTPGSTNDTAPECEGGVPTRSATWGDVKGRFHAR